MTSFSYLHFLQKETLKFMLVYSMITKPSFKLINASAGSGKTYTLVYNYMKELLLSPNHDHYRTLLALTFTNKAVNEMKSRIIKTLSEFAKKEDCEMRNKISEEINLEQREIRNKSERILKNILFNYSGFDVLTLDSFTHRIIRSFTLELKLPKSFEVIIDHDEVLNEVIDVLIDQVGIDKEITKSLVDYTHYKIDKNNNQSVKNIFLEASKIILNENDRFFLNKIKSISSKEFRETQIELSKIRLSESKKGIKFAQSILNKLSSNGIDESIFSNGMVIKHFTSIVNNNFDGIYSNNLEKNLLEGKRIIKKTGNPDHLIHLTEALIPEIYEYFINAKKCILKCNLIDELNKQWIPISFISTIADTLSSYEKEEKKILIAKFNEKISEVVEEYEAPFIYEKIGEKYKHFFIDEFQDTSKLQWKNLKPLLVNALESQNLNGSYGSVFLVGDPKQAIYRWRGGSINMFLKFLENRKFNNTEISISERLENRRSLYEIVDFNNKFFEMALESLTDLKYRSFYRESFYQNIISPKGGKVEIHFVKDKEEIIHIKKIIESLFEAKKDGFDWGSMAILVRKKNQAISTFESLSKTNIPIVSTESLLIKKSSSINLIISVLKLHIFPERSIERINICKYFIKKNDLDIYAHDFFVDSLKGSIEDFNKFLLKKFKVSFSPIEGYYFSFFELIENYINDLGLNKNFDSYLEFFLEYCYDFSIESNDIYRFLKKWERDSDKLTIPLPDDNQAVRIMTIHKAKGLQFPFVVLPFLNSDFQPSSRIRRQVWHPIEFKNTSVNFGRINFSPRLEKYSEKSKEIFDNDIKENELDALNNLYVGMTRAKAKMVIITSLFEKQKVKKNYAQLFQEFLKKNGLTPDLNRPYVFGSKKCLYVSNEEKKFKKDSVRPIFNFRWKNRLINFNSTNSRIERGVKVHILFSKIKDFSDANSAINFCIESGIFKIKKKSELSNLVNSVIYHDELKKVFELGNKIYNEKDILIPKKGFIRPDKLVLTKTTCYIIDYKTGKPKSDDNKQIKDYSNYLESIISLPIISYLVYINEKVVVKNISKHE
ncbi:MAG: hypothetical protein CMC81_00165 [Flavobacteriaceae bacterium]|nr:hypothetical protein [Flavobacteriaceae bacterium]